MKNFVAIFAIAAMAVSCAGNANKPAEEVVVEETVVVVDSTACAADSTCTADSSACTEVAAPAVK